MAVEIKVNQDQFKSLLVALNGVEKTLPRHLRAAVNKVAKTVRVKVAARLGQIMHLKSNYDAGFKKAETLKKVIKGKSWATLENATARIGLSEGYPFPLKYYDAKPYSKKKKGKKQFLGVSYRFQPARASSKWQKRRIYNDAFMLNQYGHNVYRRTGNERVPLVKVVGPAPGDYFERIKAKNLAVRVAKDRLPKEIRRRVREVLLEQKGIIKLKASRGA